MVCKNCGNKLPKKAKFCNNCGQTIMNEGGGLDQKLNENKSNSISKNKKLYMIIASVIIVLVGSFYGFYSNGVYGQIRDFESKVNDYKGRFDQYIIEEELEEYKTILASSEDIIKNKDIEKTEVLLAKLEKLNKSISSKNNEYIKESLTELKNKNTALATEDELKKINTLQADIEKKIKNNKYIDADNILKQLTEIVELVSAEHDNLEISVEQVDTSEYPNVKLYLDIKDLETSETVKNLNSKFFYLSEKLSEDSEYIKREIKKVVQLDQKESLNINMVADVSGSMDGTPINDAKTIMTNFLNHVQFGIGDKVELTAFSDGVYTIKEFTQNKDEIIDEVNSLVTGNSTSLYDALLASVNKTAVENGAKCVIAFTDGEDNYSESTAEEVLNVANRYNIPIFIIGIGDSINEDDLRYISENSNGFYTQVTDIYDMEEIYKNIYRQNKELYVLEYETIESKNTYDARDININLQTREVGGKTDYYYEPHILMSASSEMKGLSDIDQLIGNYIRGYVKAINSHDFSYIDKYVVTNGPLYKEVYPYIQKDIKQKFVSLEIIDKVFPDENTCVVTFHDTYEVQNYEEPLHMRTLRSEYVLNKQADGTWKIYAFNNRLKVISKVNS